MKAQPVALAGGALDNRSSRRLLSAWRADASDRPGNGRGHSAVAALGAANLVGTPSQSRTALSSCPGIWASPPSCTTGPAPSQPASGGREVADTRRHHPSLPLNKDRAGRYFNAKFAAPLSIGYNFCQHLP